MSQENKRCRSCGSFKAYYTMGYCRLLRENNGYCNRHNKVIDKKDSCDQWHSRCISRERRTRLVINSIPEIYKKVAVIEQILKEANEPRKISEE